jgi:hypothetical protein
VRGSPAAQERCSGAGSGSASGGAPGVAQRAETARIPYNLHTPFTVPREVFAFLEGNNWGDFHSVYHLARRYYLAGDEARQWMQQNGVEPCDVQEGDPMNGLDFLSMHRAMILRLKELFGNVPVTNDPEGFTTFAQVLAGWSSDDSIIRGLEQLGKDAGTFQRGLVNVNNFAQFQSDDEFGLFLETAMRLTNVGESNPASRNYDNDQRPGAGCHNWLHGQLEDDSSPINIGDPRTNLPNIMFWRIHGWIEAKWQQFEASRTRPADQQQWYDQYAAKYKQHMLDMSQNVGPSTGRTLQSIATGRQLLQYRPRNVPAPRVQAAAGVSPRWTPDMHRAGSFLHGVMQRRAARVVMHRRKHVLMPRSVLASMRHAMFNDRVQCWRLEEGTTSTLCPQGKRSNPGDRVAVSRPGDRRPIRPYRSR